MCRCRQGSITRRKCSRADPHGKASQRPQGSGAAGAPSSETRTLGQDEDQGTKLASVRKLGLCVRWTLLCQERSKAQGGQATTALCKEGGTSSHRKDPGTAPWQTGDG